MAEAPPDKPKVAGPLLISALALAPDVLRTVSMDAKAAGDQIYLVGLTRAELGGAVVGEIVPASARSTRACSRPSTARSPAGWSAPATT